MRRYRDGEDWTDASRVARAHRTWPCAFCGEPVTYGKSCVHVGRESAHYACSPGLGGSVWRSDLWMNPTVGSSSLIGGRDENQDAMGWAGGLERVRLIVCDGLGGHRGGREAAQAAARCVDAPWIPVEAVGVADRAVRASGPGGTTFCMAEVLRTAPQSGQGEGRTVRFTQVGDSTAWLRRVHSGKKGVWKDEVRGQTQRQGNGNMVYSCLGAPNGREVADPMVTSFPAQTGDVVVLHTDGVDPVFKGNTWHERIAPLLDTASLDEVAYTMTALAGAMGSTDNASALVFVVP